MKCIDESIKTDKEFNVELHFCIIYMYYKISQVHSRFQIKNWGKNLHFDSLLWAVNDSVTFMGWIVFFKFYFQWSSLW